MTWPSASTHHQPIPFTLSICWGNGDSGQLGVEPAYFLANIEDYLSPYDLWISLLKSLCMGIEIWVLSCYFGYTAKPGPEGVGRAANMAIVVEVVLAVLIALVITAIAYR